MSGPQGIFEPMGVTTVFASPGAGKTTQVIDRFLSAVNSGTHPGQILVLAANREAANSLRDELALKLQAATPGPLAKTLTSFAYGVLSLKAIGSDGPPPELISGSEQDRILAEIIAEHLNLLTDGVLAQRPQLQAAWPKHINAQVISLNGFRAELRDLITVSLEHNLSPTGLIKLGERHGRAEWIASANLFEQYLDRVSNTNQENRYDPTVLLNDAASWLSALAEWPASVSQITLILIDDAQELTPSASRLLEVLASRGAELVMFGDPDSSTLGFRAADPRAMSTLAASIAKKQATSVQEVFVQPTHAIRSPAISRALAKVSGQIDTARAGRQRKGLNPEPNLLKQDSTGLEGKVFGQPNAEIAWLAKRLRELHLYEGIAWNEMAVVARSKDQLAQLAIDLSHESLPVQVTGAQSALRDEFGAGTLLKFSDIVLHSRTIDSAVASDLLTSPLCGLDSLGMRRLRRALRREELTASGNRNSDELLVELFSAPGSAATLRTPEGKRVDKFLRNFFEAKAIADDTDKSIEDLLWCLWNKSDLAKSWQALSRGIGEVALQANRNLDSVVALFAAANRFAERNPNGNPRAFVDQQLALGLPEDTLALNDRNNASVLLLTPSGLIGKRFRVVSLPQLVEGVWPNLRPRSSLLGASALDALMAGRVDSPNEAQRSELPNELRMLLKAVGATSERLIVSATESEENQVSQFVRLILGEVPALSQPAGEQLTLRGMVASLRRKLAILEEAQVGNPNAKDPEPINSALLGLARLAHAGIAGAHPSSWYGLLPVSTHEPLANLPDDKVTIRPSQLENFVKCPLHWFINSHGGDDDSFSANLGSLVHQALELATSANEESMWNLVESKWHTLSFESDWLERAAERKARNMIANTAQYLRRFELDGGQVVGREANFQFEMGSAVIRGQVDRLELFPDGRVVIVDLKTGSKVFSAREAADHAQLGVYQLAFENGAFNESVELPPSAFLGGAKLLLVGGPKPVEREQSSIAASEEAKQNFAKMIALATEGMAMGGNLFIAQVGSHCTNENEYGSCQLQLTKAVSYVG